MAPIFVVYDWCMYFGIVDRPEYLNHVNNKNKRQNSDNSNDIIEVISAKIEKTITGIFSTFV